MLKIGCVNLDISHPKTLARAMKDDQMDMAYTGVYNDGFRSDAEVDAFMRQYDVGTRYESLAAMAKDVDIAFIHDCNWDKHLAHALPFLKAGKPVFIDKPAVGNLRDCRELERLAAGGAVILGSSSVRYCDELEALKKRIAENRETVMTVFAAAGVDEFNYGIHIMEGVHGLLGAGACSASYLGTVRHENISADQYRVKWANGIQVIYQTQSNIWQPFSFTVTTDKAIHHVVPDPKMLYPALLRRIASALAGDSATASAAELAETVKIYLAGKKSRESGGREIELARLQPDDPGFDGYAFEKHYAAANRA
jgi:predicted dehydrogenase